MGTRGVQVQKPWIKPTGKAGTSGKGGKTSKGAKSSTAASTRVPYSELTEERKQEIRSKHELRATEEGRSEVGTSFYEGTLLNRGKNYGWIKPKNIFKLPKNVQTKIKEMTAEKKAKALENNRSEGFDDPVIYLCMSDVSEGVKVTTGDTVQFRVYTDAHGVGALDVFTTNA